MHRISIELYQRNTFPQLFKRFIERITKDVNHKELEKYILSKNIL